MPTFHVTQRLLSVATHYDIRAEGSDVVVMSVKGSFMSATPSFTLSEGSGGKELGTLKGNFAKTKYGITATDGKELATIEFPAVAFKKSMTLITGGKTYTSQGSWKSVFRCAEGEGKPVIEVTKGLTAVRDSFSVTFDESIGQVVGLLSTVAIHSRFFEMV
ncbi:MAG: hypothetical protein ACRELY_15215 [Polyangiaceae bacterium]